MVPSDAYPVEVEAIKKIFLLVQYVLPQAPATASAVTLQLPGDVEKEVVVKDAQRPKRRNFERNWPQIMLKIAPHEKFLLKVQPCSARIAPSSFRNSL